MTPAQLLSEYIRLRDEEKIIKERKKSVSDLIKSSIDVCSTVPGFKAYTKAIVESESVSCKDLREHVPAKSFNRYVFPHIKIKEAHERLYVSVSDVKLAERSTTQRDNTVLEQTRERELERQLRLSVEMNDVAE